MENFNSNTYNETKRILGIRTQIIDEKINNKLHTEYRFAFVKTGKATIKINKSEYEIKKGDLLIITPWSISEFLEIKETLCLIIVDYSKTYITRIINYINSDNIKLLSKLENSGLISIDESQIENIAKILLEMRNELGDDNILAVEDNFPEKKYRSIYLIAKFLELLVIISRNIKGDVKISNYSETQSLIRYIYSHSNEKLSIIKLATIFFMSESSVRKHISDFSDLTFNELLYKIRLSKTEDLLLHTNLNLDEIASISGFVDGSHISKIWNMKKGVNPSMYRNLHKDELNIFSEKDREIVFNLINYINTDYSEELKIEDVAKKYSITELKVNKLLLSYVDRNFSTYLNHIRINRACEFLVNTNESIIDICFKVGYNNIKTFNNNFTKNKNMTPTQFREYESKKK